MLDAEEGGGEGAYAYSFVRKVACGFASDFGGW